MATKQFVWMALAAGMTVQGAAGSDRNPRPESSQPNILYIFPDQYRLYALSLWSDPHYRNVLSTAGDPVHTPNIDRLAREGLVFTQATSTHPVSSPYRGMMLSGMYPSRNGIEDANCKLGRNQELKHDIVCLTDVLRGAGYETAYVGKAHWHKTEALFDAQGNFVNTTEAPGGHSVGPYDMYVPEGRSRHGNAYWFQQLNDSHFNPIAYSNRPELIGGRKDGGQYRPERFSAATEADVVIRFLRNEDRERDASKPFSIFWAINPPHPPYSRLTDCDTAVFNRYYRDLSPEELLVRENVVKPSEKDKPADQNRRKRLEMNARVYFSLVKSVDEQIGRVLDTLEALGELDNTIIVFTSDHGDMMGSHGLSGKNSIYDESFLVPFIIRYPEKLRHRTEDLLLGSVDIMPTMLGLLGLGDRIPSTCAGHDYSEGLVSGEFRTVRKPLTALYLRADAKGVRSDRYTYLVDKKGRCELYDNLRDPYQMSPVDPDSIEPETLRMLQRELGQWLVRAEDKWAQTRMHADRILYPEQRV